jgi:hypothetical protein
LSAFCKHISRVQHGHPLDRLGVVVRFGGAFQRLQPRLQLRNHAEGLSPLAQRLLALAEFEVDFVVAFGRAGQQGYCLARFRRVQCAFADGARLAAAHDSPAQLQGRCGLLGVVVGEQLPAQHNLAALKGVFVRRMGQAHAQRARVQRFGGWGRVGAQRGACLR